VKPVNELSESGRAAVAQGMSPAEWQLRVELAGLFRISAHLGWEDSFNTHYTARVPGEDERFLMNPYGVRFDELKASDLVTVDPDGRVLQPTEHPVNEAGFVIHSAIHCNRSDAHCVVHTHTHAGMAVAAMEHGLLPIGIFALGFHERLSYHEFEGGSGKHNLSERERLAASLGPANNAMIMRNHGLLTVGACVAEAFVWMFRLNRACEVQTLTYGAQGNYALPTSEACRHTATATQDFLTAYGSGTPGEVEFNAFLRVVDRTDPSFRN
jgi:ribulose-5-phosphate 4-epimerase/fuculose-1-phosphate aldolase